MNDIRKFYVCKNCGGFISYKEFKKQADIKKNLSDLGCLLWTIIIVCFVSVILIPIAIILLFIAHKNEPANECPYCKAKDSVIPGDTPMAQKILKDMYDKEELKELEKNAVIEMRKEKAKLPIGCAITLWIFGLYFLFALILAITHSY